MLEFRTPPRFPPPTMTGVGTPWTAGVGVAAGAGVAGAARVGVGGTGVGGAGAAVELGAGVDAAGDGVDVVSGGGTGVAVAAGRVGVGAAVGGAAVGVADSDPQAATSSPSTTETMNSFIGLSFLPPTKQSPNNGQDDRWADTPYNFAALSHTTFVLMSEPDSLKIRSTASREFGNVLSPWG